MCDLDSDIAGRSKDTQRIAPKPKTQLSSTWRPVTKWKGETQERTKFDRDTLNQEKHDKVTDPMSTGRPVCGHQSTKRCVLTHRHVENDQTGAGRPEMVDRKEEDEIDFRVPGLSHAVVKEAEHLRVQELVKRIETHPHREALHADLQQNNVNNPFRKDSKAMILCETTPKVQCSHCLLYWNQGIVYYTCGQRFKKGRTHGARHGKTALQREYHLARNAWKRCCKKVDSEGEHLTVIHDRFLGDPVDRESQLAIGWTELKCKEWDELAKEDHTYHLTPEEKKRDQGKWYLTLNKAGKNGPMKLRSDFRAAVSMKNRLHHESGEQGEERLHPYQQRRWHSSSSTSWWDKSGWNWK